MFFDARVKECFVFYDWAAERTSKLIANQVILYAAGIRKPVFRGQRLNSVIFKQRPMPLVGTALEHRVGHETTDLPYSALKS